MKPFIKTLCLVTLSLLMNSVMAQTASAENAVSTQPSLEADKSVMQTEQERVIEVGNKLFIYVPGEPQFETLFEVDDKGEINLPEIGKVKLAGKFRFIG